MKPMSEAAVLDQEDVRQPLMEPRADDMMISADHVRFTIEQVFIATFVKDTDDGDPDEAYRLAVIRLLERGHLPSRLMMKMITDELKSKWWPKQYAQMIRATKVERDRIIIDAMAEDLKQRKGLSPARAVAEAKRELARIAHVTPDALRKRRQRQKKRDISQ
jgi:hypothetical protein